MSKCDKKVYDAGKLAKNCGLIKEDCPYGLSELRKRCAWLAGWNDA